MANGHEGARIGAGQKKKALSDKLVEGNPGKRKLTVMEFTDTADLQGETMPPPRAHLASRAKNGKELLAVEVYERTWAWLHERGCAHLIPAQILEQYAMAISRWIQCEECITEYSASSIMFETSLISKRILSSTSTAAISSTIFLASLQSSGRLRIVVSISIVARF